jgi:hypothetical protein
MWDQDKIPGIEQETSTRVSKDMSNSGEIDLYEVLDTENIRTRVAMYIGVKSLTRLYMWIMGLMSAEHFGLGRVTSDPPFGGFHEFVKEKYGFSESTCGWCAMILETERRDRWPSPEAVIESRAVDRFFVDLDEFRSQTTSLSSIGSDATGS